MATYYSVKELGAKPTGRCSGCGSQTYMVDGSTDATLGGLPTHRVGHPLVPAEHGVKGWPDGKEAPACFECRQDSGRYQRLLSNLAANPPTP